MKSFKQILLIAASLTMLATPAMAEVRYSVQFGLERVLVSNHLNHPTHYPQRVVQVHHKQPVFHGRYDHRGPDRHDWRRHSEPPHHHWRR